MKNLLIPFILLLTALVLCNCKEEQKTKVPEEIVLTSADHIAEIMQIWSGYFNNDQQVQEAESKGEKVWRGDADNGGWLNVHSHYIPLDRPDLGQNVIYVEEYRDSDPELTYRQRIYKLEIDSTDTGRVVMCTFKDKKKYLGAFNDISILDSLTSEDISPYPSKCDLIISKQGEHYVMEMKDKDCAFGDRYFNYGVKLKKGMFSYRDKIVQLSNDSLLTTAAEFKYHDLNLISD